MRDQHATSARIRISTQLRWPQTAQCLVRAGWGETPVHVPVPPRFGVHVDIEDDSDVNLPILLGRSKTKTVEEWPHRCGELAIKPWPAVVFAIVMANQERHEAAATTPISGVKFLEIRRLAVQQGQGQVEGPQQWQSREQLTDLPACEVTAEAALA